jgi:acyl-CoA synthetase (AMP-forming)/AMP-acid ligase II
MQAEVICKRRGDTFLATDKSDWVAAVGIGFGDRMAILAANRLEYLWTWIGLSRIGAVTVAVNTAYKGRFLTHVLTNTEARMGVVEREFLAWLAEIEDDISALATVYVARRSHRTRRQRSSASSCAPSRSCSARPPMRSRARWAIATPGSSCSPPAPPAPPRAC